MPEKGDEGQPDVRQLVKEDRRLRATACQQAINAALAQHRCRLDWIEPRRNGEIVERGFAVVPLD